MILYPCLLLNYQAQQFILSLPRYDEQDLSILLPNVSSDGKQYLSNVIAKTILY